jgi:hypothetical protein
MKAKQSLHIPPGVLSPQQLADLAVEALPPELSEKVDLDSSLTRELLEGIAEMQQLSDPTLGEWATRGIVALEAERAERVEKLAQLRAKYAKLEKSFIEDVKGLAAEAAHLREIVAPGPDRHSPYLYNPLSVFRSSLDSQFLPVSPPPEDYEKFCRASQIKTGLEWCKNLRTFMGTPRFRGRAIWVASPRQLKLGGPTISASRTINTRGEPRVLDRDLGEINVRVIYALRWIAAQGLITRLPPVTRAPDEVIVPIYVPPVLATVGCVEGILAPHYSTEGPGWVVLGPHPRVYTQSVMYPQKQQTILEAAEQHAQKGHGLRPR